MVLSDEDIRQAILSGRVKATASYDVLEDIQPASLDFRLGNKFKFYDHTKTPFLDPVKQKPEDVALRMIEVPDGEPFYIQPGEFVLGVTSMRIGLPADLLARVEGRSSLGRLGIIVHSTAGFVDPGFEGTITLEITNINRMPIALYPGMRVGQFAFHQMTSPALRPYGKERGSKYHGQSDPEASGIWNDREFKTT